MMFHGHGGEGALSWWSLGPGRGDTPEATENSGKSTYSKLLSLENEP